jgi:hypothetical protein
MFFQDLKISKYHQILKKGIKLNLKFKNTSKFQYFIAFQIFK